jgi:1-acyl-sn-glycerol-3-phosphate acyltransferase
MVPEIGIHEKRAIGREGLAQPPVPVQIASLPMVRTALHTTLFWTYVVLLLPPLFVVATLVLAVTLPFDKNRRILHYYTSFWCGHNVRLNPMWRLSVEGREHLDPNKAYVLCSNHQSAGDIPVLFNIYFPFKWVSKRTNFFVPFIGWAMYLNQYVGLVRGDVRSVARMMGECRRWLARGVSIMMFPEGTRSRTGALLPFKPGPFRLAISAKVPVVPIVLDGTLEALPPGLVLPQKRIVRIRVVVGAPIESSAYANIEELTSAVRERMLAMQREIWAARGYAGPVPAARTLDSATA